MGGQNQTASMQWWEAVVVLAGAAIFVVLVLAGAAHPEWFAQRKPQDDQTQAAKLQGPDLTPAPRLRKASGMRWKADGAGDSSYNGVYTPSGSYHGKPQYTNGNRWLWFDFSSWYLSPAVGVVDGSRSYQGSGVLPGIWMTIPDGT